jgi:pilus assembly protein CpaB
VQTTKTKVLFILALVFAGLAAWLANVWVQQRVSGAEKNAAVGTTAVVVAAVDIAYGQELEAVHLKLVAWPDSALPPGWVGDVSELEGKVAKRDIGEGDVVTKSRVVDHLGGSKLSALIDKNKRAMTVRVDDVVGVAGFLLPGNHVDVYGVRKDYNTKRVKVDRVLEDIVVLAVDQDASPDEESPKVVRAVTVEVTPGQAETLVKAMHEGKIQLALRNPLDKVAKAPPPPPKPKTAPPPKRITAKITSKHRPRSGKVTVIRGLNVSEVKPELNNK